MVEVEDATVAREKLHMSSSVFSMSACDCHASVSVSIVSVAGSVSASVCGNRISDYLFVLSFRFICLFAFFGRGPCVCCWLPDLCFAKRNLSRSIGIYPRPIQHTVTASFDCECESEQQIDGPRFSLQLQIFPLARPNSIYRRGPGWRQVETLA